MNQCSVCPLLRSLRSFYSHQDLYMTKKAHKCTVSVREGWFFSSSKLSSNRNSPHRIMVAEDKVLTGIAEWRGNQTSSFFKGWLVDREACFPSSPLSVSHLSCSGAERESLTVHFSSLAIWGFVFPLMDVNPW